MSLDDIDSPPPIQLPIFKMAQNFEWRLLSCVSYFRQLPIMVFLKRTSWLLNMLFSTGATSWKKSHTSSKSKLVIVNWNLYWLHRNTHEITWAQFPFFSCYLHSKLTRKVTLFCVRLNTVFSMTWLLFLQFLGALSSLTQWECSNNRIFVCRLRLWPSGKTPNSWSPFFWE